MPVLGLRWPDSMRLYDDKMLNLLIFGLYFIQLEGGRMLATRNKPKCRDDCTDHLFEIINHNGNNKHNARITFCPKPRRDPHPPEKTIPEFNDDSLYYTSAFVLGTEKKTIAKNSQHELMHFHSLVKDACQKNNQIFFPQPNEKNSYCSVCKEHFKNYFEHIWTSDHRTKIDAAVYNSEIKKLCEFYKHNWKGAHEKADEISIKIMKEREKLDKGRRTSSNNDDDEYQNDDQDEEQNEDEELEGEQGNQEQDGQDQEQQGEQDENEEDEEQASRKVGDASSMSKFRSGHPPQKGHMQQHNSMRMQFNPTNTILNCLTSKKNQMIVYLHKNANGRYVIVKDMEKFIKRGNSTAPQSKQQRQNKDTERAQERKMSKDQSHAQKETRQIFKIKQPKQKAQSSEDKNYSSSFELDENKNICEAIKNRVLRDRIKTRHQQKQQQKTKGRDKNKDKDYREGPAVSNDKSEPHKNKTNPATAREKAAYNQPPQPSTQAKNGREEPYHPSMAPNTTHPHMNPAAMMQNRTGPMPKVPMQGPPYPYGLPPNMANKMGPEAGRLPYNPYMQGNPGMMINGNQMYNPNMIAYRMQMQPPTNPSDSKADDGKARQKPPHQPPYPHPMYWTNHYMMHPSMRPNTEAGSEGQRPPMMAMPPPGYMMPGQKPGAPGMTSNMTPNPGMNPKMPMYYPVDPRYGQYMAYPPAYMQPKKADEAREPR